MSGLISATLASILLLVPWLAFFLAAAPSWREGVYYSISWAVPGMAFVLMWTRIRRLQFGRGFQSRRQSYGDSNLLSAFFWTIVVLLVGISGTALRLVETADPFWRLALLLQVLWSAAVCLIMTGLLTGPAGVRSLIGCQIFLAAAMPWPFVLENLLVVPFNELIARAAALALNFGGNPAQILGDQLWIAGTAQSIPEVVGGWFSLPAAVLLALFFGEWFSVRLPGRAGLIGVAIILAAFANFARVMWPAALAGSGFLFGGILLGLLGLGWLFRERERESLTPLPILRWHPAFFFLLLAWPVAEVVNAVWWKDGGPRAPWKLSPEPAAARAAAPELKLKAARADFFRLPPDTEILALTYAPGDSRSWNEMNFSARDAFLGQAEAEFAEALPNREIHLGEPAWPVEVRRYRDRLTGQPVYAFQLAIRGATPAESQREDARERIILSRRPGWDGLLILGRMPAAGVTEDAAFARFEQAVLALIIPQSL